MSHPSTGEDTGAALQPILETPRLALRRVCIDDAPHILELLNDPAFLAQIGDKGVRTLDDARTYIRNGPEASYLQHGFGLFLTELRPTAEPIGLCGLLKRPTLDHVDVGFAFLPRFRGRGYGYEAAAAVLAYGRDVLGIAPIVAVTSPGNTVSIALLEKLGLSDERAVRIAEDGPECRLFSPTGRRTPAE